MYITSYSTPTSHWLDGIAAGLRRKWPFQSTPAAPRQPFAGPADDAPTQHGAGALGSRQAATANPAARAADRPSLRVMMVDTALVLAWGAMIPGLMWLGHAAGF